LKIFLDTANIDEIRQGVEMGLVDGITTNPTLVAKEKVKFKDRIIEICEIVDGPVNAEVTGLTADEMVNEAREISEWAKNIVVKIPMTPEGMKAVQRLSKHDIDTNVTLIFSVNQALLAAKAGAKYVSPFIGRLDDAGQDGMALLEEIITVFQNYGIDRCEVLAASLRHPIHVKQALMLGADVATLPYKVFEQLFKHPLTDIGLKRFLDDWESVKGLV
jgi:transaldolase